MKKSNKQSRMTSGNESSNGQKSFKDMFYIAIPCKRRGRKSIYIRQEYHERITRIIQIIGEGEIPLYACLDNIL